MSVPTRTWTEPTKNALKGSFALRFSSECVPVFDAYVRIAAGPLTWAHAHTVEPETAAVCAARAARIGVMNPASKYVIRPL